MQVDKVPRSVLSRQRDIGARTNLRDRKKGARITAILEYCSIVVFFSHARSIITLWKQVHCPNLTTTTSPWLTPFERRAGSERS